MEKSLILQIARAELLQEEMRVLDDLQHLGVILFKEKIKCLVWDTTFKSGTSYVFIFRHHKPDRM